MTRKKIFVGHHPGMLQAQPFKKTPLIEVTGDNRVLVENHLGVISYCLNEILIKVNNGIIEVMGDKMEILCMSKERIAIGGVIYGINLRRNSR